MNQKKSYKNSTQTKKVFKHKSMTATNFIEKWRWAKNYLGRPSVGIHVGWDQIPQDSKVKQLYEREAWEKIYEFTPPWFKKPTTFKDLFKSKNSDYQQIVKEETGNGKINYYRNKGLTDTSFCAFSNPDESLVILGDGNHRFFDCAYLIEEGYNFFPETEKVTIDLILLKNFEQVLQVNRIWQNFEVQPRQR